MRVFHRAELTFCWTLPSTLLGEGWTGMLITVRGLGRIVEWGGVGNGDGQGGEDLAWIVDGFSGTMRLVSISPAS